MEYIKRFFSSSYVPWRLFGALLCFNLVSMALFISHPSSLDFSQPTSGSSALIAIVGPICAGLLCMWGGPWPWKRFSARREATQMRRFSPFLWGLIGYVYAVGHAIWFGQILLTRRVPPYPGANHCIELLTYVCFITAILLLPTRSISLYARLRILLDSLIIMVAVATFCYYFLVGPLLATGHGTQLAKVIGGLYSVLDLLAMFSVLVVALRSGEPILRPVLCMLGLAAVLQFIVNLHHFTEMLYKNYNEFSAADGLLAIYGMLLVVSAQTVNAIQRARQASEVPETCRDNALCAEPRWKIVLPAALALVFGLLVFLLWWNGAQTFPGQISIVYIGGFAVLVLMLLRQILAIYQIGVLQGKLQQKNISLDHLNAQLEKQATADSLTGLPNHRALAERLDELLACAELTATPCSIIFMDIDHFKEINDYYGHLVGDTMLNRFARTVTAAVRVGDAVGRWGGEEFVAILPQTDLAEACQLAERIRVATHQQVVTHEGKLELTCSLGVATYPQDATAHEDLIKHADRAMYAAKRLGRDQVRTAHEAHIAEKREVVQVNERCTQGCIPKVVEALQALAETREPLLGQHARRVAELARSLAQEMGLSQAEVYTVYLGGLLHNLGHVAMPDALLLKRVLWNRRDLEQQARYPELGAEILDPIPALRPVALIVRTHRAWLDGTGYPANLAGESIPLGARIVAVASVYDTYLSLHPTCPALALQGVSRHAGSRFDARVVEALRHVLARAPSPARIDVA
ncbi:MAG TPA: diguanylate cyclase [Ktedonobacteraceae bacterium]